MTAFTALRNPERLVAEMGIRQRLTLIVVTPLLFFVVCLGLTWPRVVQTHDTVTGVTREAQAALTVTALLHQIAISQDALRSYLVTSEAPYLARYGAAKARTTGSEQRLLRLLRENPSEEALAGQVIMVATGLFRGSDATIERARTGKLTAAQRRAAVVRWPRRVDALVGPVGALQAAQLRELDRYKAGVEGIRRGWTVLLVALSAFAVIVTLALAGIVCRCFGRRVEALAEKSRRFSRGEEVGAPLDGIDEIAELDQAFHAMVEEVRAREAEFSYYAVLAESVRDMIIFVDPTSKRILRANRACCESLGYLSEELTALTLDALRPGEPTGFELIREGRRLGEILYETICIRKDGTRFPIEVSGHSARVDGRQVLVMVARDVTERHNGRKQLADALDGALSASKAKSEFLATMSHEIRTPMNVVLGITESLQETALDDEQREHVALIREAGSNLMSVINDILDFSKIEAGKLELASRSVSCFQLVDSIRGMFAPQAQAKYLQLTARADPRIAPAVTADGGRLTQILTNLAGNALKFTDAGRIAIDATLVDEVGDVQTIEFAVEDTGAGIPADLRPVLFEPFTQADGSRTRRQTGTGLGLSICKRLVELMGGEIGVTSEPNHGSRFWFRVPLKRAEPEAPALPAEEPAGRGAPETASQLGVGPLLHVLLVEDHWMNRRVAVGQLTKLGLSVSVAENGFAGVARATTQTFDLIFMDCQMPGLDGLSATRSIRRAERATGAHVPIIAMTANVFEEERNQCFAAGMDDFVAKPVTLDALRCAIARWLPDRPESVAS